MLHILRLSFPFFTAVTCVTLTNWRVCSNVKFLGCCNCMKRGRLSIGCIHEPVDLTEESATKAATGSSTVLVMLMMRAIRIGIGFGLPCNMLEVSPGPIESRI